jgi:hypothetical protein
MRDMRADWKRWRQSEKIVAIVFGALITFVGPTIALIAAV